METTKLLFASIFSLTLHPLETVATFRTSWWQKAAFSPRGGERESECFCPPSLHPGGLFQCGPQRRPSPLTLMRAESGVAQKPGPMRCAFEMKSHSVGACQGWNATQCALFTEMYRHFWEECPSRVSLRCLRQKCMGIVQRNLTCRCSTGLSHSSCSSPTSMSEDSWSGNTHMLQCLVCVFSILKAEMGYNLTTWNSYTLNIHSIRLIAPLLLFIWEFFLIHVRERGCHMLYTL